MGLRSKLEDRKDWNTIKGPIELLAAIKELTHNYQDSKYPITSIYKSIKTLMNIRQDDKEAMVDFIKRFRNAKDIMEAQHGILPLTKYIQTDSHYDEDDREVCEELSKEAYEKFIAYAYIQAASQNRAGKLEEDLANSYVLGQNSYPNELSEAISVVINY